MTLAIFATLRKQELFDFLRQRFGRSWRKVVTHQLGIHPRTFERWKCGVSVPRHLARVEAWARLVGFVSPLDAEFCDAIAKYRNFRRRTLRLNDKNAHATERKPRGPEPEGGMEPAVRAAILYGLDHPNPPR